MGISYLGARMMWNARQRGVRFDRVLTLGHQSLRLFPSEVEFFRKVYIDAYGPTTRVLDNYEWGDFFDDFLRDFLGASSVTVLDASPYQGAETIHDMNYPVPAQWHNSYDVVIDGGSLEHIFNVPTAFKNLANMLKVGGTIFVNTPANNLMGHGFYQFSPEFMYRVFSPENGFAVEDVMLYEAPYPGVELSKKKTVFHVVDPDHVRQRVGLLNKKAVMMMVEAKKTHDAEMFSKPPLQSDYVTTWSAAEDRDPALDWRRRAKQAVQSLPISVRSPLEGLRQKRKFSLQNRRFYSREHWTP